MKILALIILIALSGCVSGHWFPKWYSSELAYKCQINPYDADCFQPPPVFQGPK
ncbi:hypothetical protein D3C72_1878590 [compost metagenome]